MLDLLVSKHKRYNVAPLMRGYIGTIDLYLLGANDALQPGLPELSISVFIY